MTATRKATDKKTDKGKGIDPSASEKPAVGVSGASGGVPTRSEGTTFVFAKDYEVYGGVVPAGTVCDAALPLPDGLVKVSCVVKRKCGFCRFLPYPRNLCYIFCRRRVLVVERSVLIESRSLTDRGERMAKPKKDPGASGSKDVKEAKANESGDAPRKADIIEQVVAEMKAKKLPWNDKTFTSLCEKRKKLKAGSHGWLRKARLMGYRFESTKKPKKERKNKKK